MPNPAVTGAGLVSAALFLAAVGWLLQGTAWNLHAFQQLNSAALQWSVMASALSVLGLGAAAIVMVSAIGPERPMLPAATLVVVLVGGLAVQAAKFASNGARPLEVLGPESMHLVGAALHTRSMPSGHAALWVALATLAVLLSGGGAVHRIVIGSVAAVVAACGAMARVVVGAHWPADLLVGAGLGMAAAALAVGTPTGWAMVRSLALAMQGKTGSRLMAALLTGLAASHWVAERDYPEAAACHGLLAAIGLAAAWRWWRLHPGPAPGRPIAARRAHKGVP